MFNGRDDGSTRDRILVFAAIMTAFMLFLQISSPMRAITYEDELPRSWVGDDFIISYPNGYNASHPAIAMTPTNEITKDRTAGSIHVVWDELVKIDEVTLISEIFYSRSTDGGYKWTGEDRDIIISNMGKANSGDAVNPSLTVDSHGRIHVTWAEYYPDYKTWNLHYIRSDDNGDSWITFPQGPIDPSLQERYIFKSISAPKISIGIMPGISGPDIIHATWSANVIDKANEREYQEIFYSTSIDLGLTWSGQMISYPDQEPGTGDAFDPSISVSKLSPVNEVIHATWMQKMGVHESIYYINSINGKWGEERLITPFIPEGMLVSDISMEARFDTIHLIWSQMPSEQKAPPAEIQYSLSQNNGGSWTSQEIVIPINNNDDQNPPMTPSLAVDKDNRVYAFWCEFDSEKGSFEVHTSVNPDPLKNPTDWTGREKDEIISSPSGQDASNVAATIDELPDHTWRPQVVWQEPKPYDRLPVKSGSSNFVHASPQNDEIHYDPPGSPPVEYTIGATAGSGGYISPSGDVTVQGGDDQTFNIYANTGYHITNVYVDGSPQGAITSYTFYNVNDNHSISAYFAINTYTLTINTIGSGSVTKTPDQPTYNHGQTVQLNAIPVFGWQFYQWSGSLTGSTNPASIYMNGDKSVAATFTQNIYNISLQSGWNLVSLPFNQSSTSVSTVLSSISGSYDLVKYYDVLDTGDHWKKYRPGSMSNDLTDIDHTMAIWIHTNTSCTLRVYGKIESSTVIQLYSGWNFVGYPSQTPRLASNTLPGTANVVSVFQTWSPWVSDVTNLASVTMSQGNGYWVHVTSDTTWTVNW